MDDARNIGVSRREKRMQKKKGKSELKRKKECQKEKKGNENREE